MKYTGTLIEESLIDEAFLNFASVTERTQVPLQGASAEQLPHVTIIKFTVGDDFVGAVIEEISKSLKAKGWFGEVQNEYEKWVIFPNKIFKYAVKDVTARQKAIDYGISLGIPEVQIKGI